MARVENFDSNLDEALKFLEKNSIRGKKTIVTIGGKTYTITRQRHGHLFNRDKWDLKLTCKDSEPLINRFSNRAQINDFLNSKQTTLDERTTNKENRESFQPTSSEESQVKNDLPDTENINIEGFNALTPKRSRELLKAVQQSEEKVSEFTFIDPAEETFKQQRSHNQKFDANSNEIETTEVLGQGTFGTVSAGTIETNTGKKDVIIKQANEEEYQDSIDDEKNRSDAIVKGAEDNFDKSKKEDGTFETGAHAELQGMDNIVTVKGQLKTGEIIQERVKGKDLCDSINQNSGFFENGVPRDTKEAVMVAASFMTGLQALHATGHCHNDIKIENVMLEKNPSEYKTDEQGNKTEIDTGYTIKLIDLGGATKSEATEGMAFTIIPPEWHKNVQQASPSSDIFAATNVIMTTLFGYNGAILSDFLLFPQKNKPISDFTYALRSGNEKGAMKLLVNRLNASNRNIPEEKRYPPEVMDKLKAIFIGMTRADPSKRLTATEILSELESIGLSNWEEKSLGIEGLELESAKTKIDQIKNDFRDLFQELKRKDNKATLK